MQRFKHFLHMRSLALFGSLLLLIVLVTACGSNGGGTTTGSGGSGGKTPTASPTAVKGYGSALGCPSDVVMTNLPPSPNVVIQASQSNSTVTTSVGSTIEVHLPFGHKWQGPVSTSSVLQLQQPAGYALKSQNVCVWRFVAKTAGTTKIAFTSQALCKTGELCPMYIAVFSFNLDVK